MKEVQLTQGKVALVDDEDYDFVVAAGTWRAWAPNGRKIFYAYMHLPRSVARARGRQRVVVSMHSFIMGESTHKINIDHIDHDGLNNQRYNLRWATQGQQNANTRKRTGCSSQFKGVCWDASRCLWIAQLGFNNKLKFLGRFDSEEDAARAYDAAALSYFGPFAKTNFGENSAL